MKKKNNVKRLVGLALLAAIVAVLQLLSLIIKFGPFSITLALIPLVVGAIIYGPKGGFILGFVMGLIILLTNSEAFFVVNPLATVLICLVKSSVAGFLSGLFFKLLKNKNERLAVVIASLTAPLVNTGLFAIGVLIFFMPTLREWAEGSNAIGYLFLTIIGINFIIEFVINSILSSTVYYIENTVTKRFNLGNENNELEEVE